MRKQKQKIVGFIKNTVKKSQLSKVVLGWSGGIDSTTCLYLLSEAIAKENILIYHLPYFNSFFYELKTINKTIMIPEKNITEIKIIRIANYLQKELTINDNLRFGNLLARIRMMILYNEAKKHNALVCGTENRSEHLLGYFTRFGDSASDFEPILHLYKTEVFQMARFLQIPEIIINKAPTAGLWKNQTDEGEFGFTYEEADRVMQLYFDKKFSIVEIKKKGYLNAKKIVDRCIKNHFKHTAPYSLA